MSLTTRLLCALLSTILAACSSRGGSSGEGMSAAMASWKGHRVSEAVGMWGMPDSIGREGTLAVLQWKGDYAVLPRIEWDAKDRDTPSREEAWPTLCYRVLAVDELEIIRQARWFGSECSTDPVNYAAPGWRDGR